VEDLIIFHECLKRTPSITKLKILHIISMHVTPLGLSLSSLLQLNSIDCPSSLILDFIPSHLLKRIALSGIHYLAWDWLVAASLPPMTLEDIAVMMKLIAVICALEIPTGLYFIAQMDQHFPHLEKFHLNFVHPNHVHQFPDGPGINVSYACLELSF